MSIFTDLDLDLGEPVALVLLAVLHFITDRTRAAEFVHELMAAPPPGSYLLASHATQDFETPEAIATYRTMLDQGRSDVWPATRADMAAVFDGFTLIEPGIAPAGEWRLAAGTEIPAPKSVGLYAGVARKD